METCLRFYRLTKITRPRSSTPVVLFRKSRNLLVTLLSSAPRTIGLGASFFRLRIHCRLILASVRARVALFTRMITPSARRSTLTARLVRRILMPFLSCRLLKVNPVTRLLMRSRSLVLLCPKYRVVLRVLPVRALLVDVVYF